MGSNHVVLMRVPSSSSVSAMNSRMLWVYNGLPLAVYFIHVQWYAQGTVFVCVLYVLCVLCVG